MTTRPLTTVVSTLTAVAVGATCLTTVTAHPAAAAAPCVTAFPQADLVPGQAVSGLTVSRGTEPDAFEGTIAGVLGDGIAPGVDMILAELSSPAIDANGIWAGMSGSPVYADAERTQLVGAVSYTLNEGKTTLAGITPAADMLDLTAEPAQARVHLTARLEQRLAAAGSATPAQLSAGLRRLPTPIAVSGLTERRFRQLSGWLDDHGPVSNAIGGGATSAADAGDIVPGGNVAASLGWGFVTAAATGTVTSVCGDDVLAFGHPFAYAGESAYSLHPATAVAIVPGATFAGFKLANLGERVGAFTGDRLAGIRGSLGEGPTAYAVTSTATQGTKTLSGTTRVTVQDLVADAGLANAFAVSDRVLDRAGRGSAKASWTVTGKRRTGAAFSFTHSDVYTSTSDVASAPLADLAVQLSALLENRTEAVTITGIRTSTQLRSDATRWQIGRTYQRRQGAWKRITARAPAVLKAGRSGSIRVELFSRDANTRFVTVPVSAGRKSVGRAGKLTLQGGFAGEDDLFFYDSSEEFLEEYEDEILGGEVPPTIPQVLSLLRTDQKNDTVASTFTVRGTATKKGSVALGQVVSGRVVVPVKVRR